MDEQALAILRELVKGDLAGVVIVPHEAFDCAYCDGSGNVVQISKRQSRYTFDHAPDCPIFRGREWLAAVDRKPPAC